MPILEQGYEPYRGPVHRGSLRFLSIARAAIRRNHRWYTWVLLLASWAISSGMEYVFVFVGYGIPAMGLSQGSGPDPFIRRYLENLNFYPDLMASQHFWALAMAAMIGAGEIAEDFRTGALTVYLGRPVTRTDYVLGKATAVSFGVLAVTFLPTVVLFVVQSLFIGTWDWFAGHARIPLAVLGSSLVVCVYASGFVLGLSALVRRRRWATVTVAGVLVGLTLVGSFLAPSRKFTSDREQEEATKALMEAKTVEEKDRARDRITRAMDPIGSGSRLAEWRALSPGSLLAACERDLFGSEVPSNFPPGRHWALALGVPLLLLGLLGRRVRAVEVVA